MTLLLVFAAGVLLGASLPVLRRLLHAVLLWYIVWNTARLYRKDPERAKAWADGVARGYYGKP